MADEKVERKIDGLMVYLKEYLDLRFSHACRINPSIQRIREDLMWHEIASLRQVMAENKAWGPDKYVVIDILTSFDEKKITNLFTQTDNQQIFSEIVTEADTEKKKQQMDAEAIKDIGTFYKSIDPSLGATVLLVQTWIWWDLKDALILNLLDLQAERIAALQKMEMSTNLQVFYRNEMHLPEKSLTMEDVLAFELKRTRAIEERFNQRRQADPGYQIIIRRDPAPDKSFESQITALAHRLRVVDSIKKANKLDDAQKQYYAKLLRREPDSLTVEAALQCETSAIATARAALAKACADDQGLGEPYDFKKSQCKLAREKVARIEKMLGEKIVSLSMGEIEKSEKKPNAG